MRHYSTWNPQNGYIPRPREYVRLVGACHPRSLGHIVLVTKVYEDEDGWWFESSHQERGEVLYKKVYAVNADRVRSEMLRLSPELAAWAMIEGYGKTLSRDRLDTKSRELCIVAQLTQLGWERQLYSHILGAKNVGASHDEIAEAVAIGAYGDVDLLASAEQLVAKIV